MHQIGGAQHSQKSNQNFIAIVSYSNVSQMNVFFFFVFFDQGIKSGNQAKLGE